MTEIPAFAKPKETRAYLGDTDPFFTLSRCEIILHRSGRATSVGSRE
jgi:hypothetical protein